MLGVSRFWRKPNGKLMVGATGRAKLCAGCPCAVSFACCFGTGPLERSLRFDVELRRSTLASLGSDYPSGGVLVDTDYGVHFDWDGSQYYVGTTKVMAQNPIYDDCGYGFRFRMECDAPEGWFPVAFGQNSSGAIGSGIFGGGFLAAGSYAGTEQFIPCDTFEGFYHDGPNFNFGAPSARWWWYLIRVYLP
jgi:hypothetical protein